MVELLTPKFNTETWFLCKIYMRRGDYRQKERQITQHRDILDLTCDMVTFDNSHGKFRNRNRGHGHFLKSISDIGDPSSKAPMLAGEGSILHQLTAGVALPMTPMEDVYIQDRYRISERGPVFFLLQMPMVLC